MDKQKLMNELMEKLASHDWDYQYSDDHRAWRSGSDEAAQIVKLVNLLKLSKADIDDLELQCKHIKKLAHRFDCFKNPIFTNA